MSQTKDKLLKIPEPLYAMLEATSLETHTPVSKVILKAICQFYADTPNDEDRDTAMEYLEQLSAKKKKRLTELELFFINKHNGIVHLAEEELGRKIELPTTNASPES